MTKENKNKGYKLLLYDLAESISSNEEIAINFFKEEGIDIEKYVLYGINSIKKTQFIEIAKQNKQRDEALLELAFEKLKEFTDKNKELAGEKLRNLLHETASSYQFRNLEKLDDEGIRELLTEIDLIRLLEKLDNKEES